MGQYQSCFLSKLKIFIQIVQQTKDFQEEEYRLKSNKRIKNLRIVFKNQILLKKVKKQLNKKAGLKLHPNLKSYSIRCVVKI